MYNTEFVLKLHIYSKIIFLQNKYTYTTHQYWEKVSKIFHTFFQYLRLSTIMNLVFCNARLGSFMTSCRDKLYHHTIKTKILIILFGKMYYFVWHLVRNQKNDWLWKTWLVTTSLKPKKSKFPVACDRNSVSDLGNRNDAATNGVDGRTIVIRNGKIVWKVVWIKY